MWTSPCSVFILYLIVSVTGHGDEHEGHSGMHHGGHEMHPMTHGDHKPMTMTPEKDKKLVEADIASIKSGDLIISDYWKNKLGIENFVNTMRYEKCNGSTASAHKFICPSTAQASRYHCCPVSGSSEFYCCNYFELHWKALALILIPSVLLFSFSIGLLIIFKCCLRNTKSGPIKRVQGAGGDRYHNLPLLQEDSDEEAA